LKNQNEVNQDYLNFNIINFSSLCYLIYISWAKKIKKTLRWWKSSYLWCRKFRI